MSRFNPYVPDAADEWLAKEAPKIHGPERIAAVFTKHPVNSAQDHRRHELGEPLKRARLRREDRQRQDGLGLGGSYVPPPMRRTFTNSEWQQVQAAKAAWRLEHVAMERWAESLNARAY